MNGVLDASMALAWIFTRANPAEAALAEQKLHDLTSDAWVVPAIWQAEVGNALLRAERAGLIPSSQSAFFLSRLFEARIEIDFAAGRAQLFAALALARTHGLSAYDATYLELALRTGRTLATFDQKLAEAARQAGGRICGDAD